MTNNVILISDDEFALKERIAKYQAYELKNKVGSKFFEWGNDIFKGVTFVFWGKSNNTNDVKILFSYERIKSIFGIHLIGTLYVDNVKISKSVITVHPYTELTTCYVNKTRYTLQIDDSLKYIWKAYLQYLIYLDSHL